MSKAKNLYYRAFNKITFLKEDTKEFFKSEQGDTNFLSILIILGIAISIAITFLAFGKDITDFISKRIKRFKDAVEN